jgi:hypothetical protein
MLANDAQNETVANCDSDQFDELKRFVFEDLSHNHIDTMLISSVNRTKKFLIHKSVDTSISEIFRLVELNKDRLRIREWGLSTSTLEDAFISAVEDA